MYIFIPTAHGELSVYTGQLKHGVDHLVTIILLVWVRDKPLNNVYQQARYCGCALGWYTDFTDLADQYLFKHYMEARMPGGDDL